MEIPSSKRYKKFFRKYSFKSMKMIKDTQISINLPLLT